MTPKVSIIIPVFNKEEWIKATLETVAMQTFHDWECIVIDDGSTDKSLEIIQNFIATRSENWRIFSQINQGQGAARNFAIDRAEGEYIAFLDGDDTWSPNKLEVQTALLNQDPSAVLAICPYVIFKANQSRSSQRIVDHGKAKKLIHNWTTFRGFGGGTESTGLVRKAALLAVGGFNPKLSTSAGADLTMRLARIGKILNARDSYMQYRIHTGQWHTNHEILKRDAMLLYQGMVWINDSERQYLARCCAAYLDLQELRQNRKLGTILRLIGNPRTFAFFIILLTHIFLRNSMARLRALFPALLTRFPAIYRDQAFDSSPSE